MTLEKAKEISKLMKEYSRTDKLFNGEESNWRVKIYTENGCDYPCFEMYESYEKELIDKLKDMLKQHRNELKFKIERLLK